MLHNILCEAYDSNIVVLPHEFFLYLLLKAFVAALLAVDAKKVGLVILCPNIVIIFELNKIR